MTGIRSRMEHLGLFGRSQDVGVIGHGVDRSGESHCGGYSAVFEFEYGLDQCRHPGIAQRVPHLGSGGTQQNRLAASRHSVDFFHQQSFICVNLPSGNAR